MHGFAFNVTRESLPPFQAITPCGIQGVQMTCLEQEMPESGQKDDLLNRFGNVLQHGGRKNSTGIQGMQSEPGSMKNLLPLKTEMRQRLGSGHFRP